APLVWGAEHHQRPLKVGCLDSANAVDTVTRRRFDSTREVVFVQNVRDAGLVKRVLLDEQGWSNSIDDTRQRVELAVEQAIPPGALRQVREVGERFNGIAADELAEVGALTLEELGLVGDLYAQHVHGEDVWQLAARD